MRWPERAFRTISLAALYTVVSGVVLDVYLTRWGPELGAEYTAVLRHEVARPYVYRVLSPAIVDAVTRAIPAPVARALLHARLPRERAGADALPFALASHRWPGEPSLSVLVGIGLMFFALWGTLWVFRAIAAWARPGRPLLAACAPAIALLALPATFSGGGFLHDFPDLFLVSLAMWAFVRERWAVFYVVLPLVVLDREASVLLVAWFVASIGSMPRRRLVAHLAASSLLGGTVAAALLWVFRSSPGAVLQTNLASNLRFWARLRWLFASDDLLGLGLPLPVATHAAILALVLGAWFYGRRRAPPLASRMLAASLLAVAPLFLVFGFENEIRVFSIAFPPLFVLGVGAADARAAPAA